MAARSVAGFCGRSLAGIAGSNPAGGMDVCFFVSVVYGQVVVSASGSSLLQRSPTECGMSECDLETSTMKRPRPTRSVEPREGGHRCSYVYCHLVCVCYLE